MQLFTKKKSEPYHEVALSYQDVVWLRNNYAPAKNYWTHIKEVVCKREQGKCQYCGGRGTEIHHTKYRNVLFHEHLFIDSRDILVWTCRSCHEAIEGLKKSKKPSKRAQRWMHA